MKDKRVIRQVLTIYLVCFVARIFEYFVLRTDQTILGEAFIHKLFGIIVICLVVRRSGETLSDIGFVKNDYIRSAVKGLVLGLSMFTIGYFVEILILMQNRTYAGIRFYVSAYAVDTNIAKQTSVLFILICIIGNFINVLMEEGLFRGLFPRMLNSRRFWNVTSICSLLFGVWHIVGPVRNYIDGQSSFQGMIANAIMLIVSSTLVGLKLAMITYMEGNLYMGMADHFVNNTIVNLLHIESSTGADEMMFLRITVAQTISFFIVLFIFLERKNHGKKGIINKTESRN